MTRAQAPSKGSDAPRTSTSRPKPAAAGVEHVAFQLEDASSPAAATAEESEASAAAEEATSEDQLYGVVIEDGLPPGEGQVNRSTFIDELAPAIESAADEILVPAGRVAADCPYLAFWINYYRQQSAAHIERAIRRYVRPERTDRAGIEEEILAHVRRAVQAWVDRRDVVAPPEIDWRVADDAIAPESGDQAVAQRMGEDGAGAPAAAGSAAAVRARLSAGRPLEGSVRARMERGFGTGFSNVRVHTDSRAASVAKAYSARAFAVGQDIGFAAGQYRPGSLAGDVLLAHELAHTIQQRSATAEGPAAAGLESDATTAALGAMLPDTALDSRPRLSGALGLRRCGTGEEPAPPSVDPQVYEDTVSELRRLYARKRGIAAGTTPASESAEIDRRIGELAGRVRSWGVQLSDRQLQRAVEADEDLRPLIGEPLQLDPEDMADRGFSLITPGGEPTVGRSYSLSVVGPLVMSGSGSTSDRYFGFWYARRPGETSLNRVSGVYSEQSHVYTLDVAGAWQLAVSISIDGGRGILTHNVTVREPSAVAAERLGQVQTTDEATFLARLETQNLMNMRLGVADQHFVPDAAYITLSGPNPADPDSTSRQTYTAHPSRGFTPTRYEWVAVPDDLSRYPTQGYMGYSRRRVAGRDGFDLGTDATATWGLWMTGIVHINCTMYNAAGATDEAVYRQVTLTRAEADAATRFRTYMAEARTELRKIREDTAIFVPAYHIARETGVATELSLFVGQPPGGSGLKIIDVTPAVPRREYGGADFTAALNDFNDGNSYPVGAIRLRVPQNTLGIAAQDWDIQTQGASIAQRLSTGWGWASLGLAGLGVLAAIIPGTQPLAPAFFLASGALGAASAGASLYQRSQEAHPSGIGIAIDIASLVGSLMGMAGAANLLRHGPRVAALTRVGRFVLYTGFATDAIGGVFILAESAEQIAAILEGPGNAEDKASQITRILAGLLLNGALLAFGARDFRATRARLTSILADDVMRGLSGSEIHMLGLLEGPAMARLASAPLEEVRSVASLIREDPVRAGALFERYGESFVIGARSRPENLEALEQALHAGAPEAGGTRGSFGPAGGAGPRPVYLQAPNQSSPLNLADRLRQVFMSPGSPANVRIQLLEGARLEAVAGAAAGAPQVNYRLVIPPGGGRPEIVVPVTIRSVGPEALTSVHGAETGPARLTVRSTEASGGGRNYTAEIQVRSDLARQDVGYAVGHELNETVGIARSGLSGDAITAQKRASLMRPQNAVVAAGGVSPPITPHDRATAREFADFVAQRVPPNGRPANFGLPQDVLSRALSVGVGGPAFLEDKLALLRSVGLDEDMIGRLRVMALGPSVAAAMPATSPFADPALFGHLLAWEPSALPQSPIGGLHLDSALDATQRGMIQRNDGFHLVRTADSPRGTGNLTFNAYEQWVWTTGGTPGPRPPGPGTASPFGGWQRRDLPKTTFNNLPAFLTEAEAAWNAWRAANPTEAGTNRQWRQAGPSGQMIEGWADLSVNPPRMRSVYPYRVGGLNGW